MSATAQPTRRPIPRTSRSGGLPFDEFLVLAALTLLLCAVLLPLLAVALPLALVFLVGTRRGWWPAWLPVLVGVLTGLAWALWLRAHGGWETALQGYLTVQQDALDRVLATGSTADLLPMYLRAVWPYAVPGGVVLGSTVSSIVSLRWHEGATVGETVETDDAGVLAAADDAPMDWAVENVLGRGVMTLLSGPAGIGKGYWTWALLRAMQRGESFYGLPVHRPWRSRRGLLRRQAQPMRVLWLTEEGRSFKHTARLFGIQPGLVRKLDQKRVGLREWPEVVALASAAATRERCAYVVVDTIRAWCPEAEESNGQAKAVLGLARQEWVEKRNLGVLFVHHDTKLGGEHGLGVSGPNYIVGGQDILVQLRRVTGRPNARRMVVSRRFGDQDITAALDAAYRYVPDATDALAAFDERLAAVPVEAPAPEPPQIPDRLVPALDIVRRAGHGGLSTSAIQDATGTARATVLRHLADLEESKHIGRSGAGTRHDPYVWTAAILPAPAPTADPAYVRYLGTKEWRERCAPVLQRALGRCEDCGAAPADGDTLEVHHLHYRTLYAERPEDLLALDAGCHRRAHAGGKV